MIQSGVPPTRYSRSSEERAASAHHDMLALFAVLWAMATLFHVWVNPWSARVIEDPTLLGASLVALSVAAIAVLCRPRALPALLAMAYLGLLTCWLEAPVLGNHWLLAAIVNLGLLLAALRSLTRSGMDRDRIVAGFFPVARWTLIAFYLFAALAKVNRDFLDPRVSCSVFFGDELMQSLHLGSLDPTGQWARLLPFAVVGIELAIPLLLAVRRSRHIGVAVGMAYHGVIALNMTHLFGDFSSVVAALFVLFLPSSFATSTVELVRRHARLASAIHATTVGAAAIVLLALWARPPGASDRFFLNGRTIMWFVFDAVIVLLVFRFLLRSPASGPPARPAMAITPRWLVLVPALVVLNGLSPYLELKTAYGWNMYSNLQTANGETNHLLVPRTVALTDVQRDLVRIQATNDPGLGLYATERYDLPFRQLQAYLNRHPEVSLVFDRGGERFLADPAFSDPDLVRPVPGWRQKLQAFRAVDQTQPVRCQPSFFPAH